MARVLDFPQAALMLAVVAMLAFVLAPPPRASRAEGAVYSVVTGQVDVTSTVTTVAAARPGRFDVNVEQLSANADLYCGSPAITGPITTANGHLLPAGKGSNLTLHTAARVDCISVGATARVSYAEDF